MAVISHELHWNGSSGGRTVGKRRYTAVYRVFTDSGLDQTKAILDYFEDTDDLPWIGDPYDYANDSDPDAYCNGIDPNGEMGSATIWVVSVSFETPGEEEERPGKDGKPQTDPLQWAGQVDVGHVFRSDAVYKAKWLGNFKITAGGNIENIPDPAGWNKDQLRAVTNSAGTIFNPPLEREAAITTLRLQEPMPSYQPALQSRFLNAVNSDAMTIPLPVAPNRQAGLAWDWEQYTARVVEIGGSLNFANGIFYWMNRLEIHHDPLTWVDEVPDRGLAAAVKDNAPKGYIGEDTSETANYKYTSLDIDNFKEAGIPLQRVLADPRGAPLRELVLFDGFGNPLLDPDLPPVFLRYLKYREDDLRDLFAPNGPFSV